MEGSLVFQFSICLPQMALPASFQMRRLRHRNAWRQALQGAISSQAQSTLASVRPQALSSDLWMISSSGLDSRPFGLLVTSLHPGRAKPGSVIFGKSFNHAVTQSKPAGKPGMTQAPGKPAVAPNWPFSAKSSTALERSTDWGGRLGRV